MEAAVSFGRRVALSPAATQSPKQPRFALDARVAASPCSRPRRRVRRYQPRASTAVQRACDGSRRFSASAANRERATGSARVSWLYPDAAANVRGRQRLELDPWASMGVDGAVLDSMVALGETIEARVCLRDASPARWNESRASRTEMWLGDDSDGAACEVSVRLTQPLTIRASPDELALLAWLVGSAESAPIEVNDASELDPYVRIYPANAVHVGVRIEMAKVELHIATVCQGTPVSSGSAAPHRLEVTRPWGDVRASAVAEAAAARADSQPDKSVLNGAGEDDEPTEPAAPLLALTIAALQIQMRRTTHASRVRVSADEAQAHLAAWALQSEYHRHTSARGPRRPSTAADQSVPWLRVHSATGRGVA